MSDMTVSKAQALLGGATPGPWLANGEPWNLIVWSAADNRVCFMAHSNGLDDDRDVATAELVAAAPDLARAYIAAMKRIEAADKLVEALAKIEGLDDSAECCGVGVQNGYGQPECCELPIYGLGRALLIARAALSAYEDSRK